MAQAIALVARPDDDELRAPGMSHHHRLAASLGRSLLVGSRGIPKTGLHYPQQGPDHILQGPAKESLEARNQDLALRAVHVGDVPLVPTERSRQHPRLDACSPGPESHMRTRGDAMQCHTPRANAAHQATETPGIPGHRRGETRSL